MSASIAEVETSGERSLGEELLGEEGLSKKATIFARVKEGYSLENAVGKTGIQGGLGLGEGG